MKSEILEKMKSRQQYADKNSLQYKALDREIRNDCRKAKEDWLNIQCQEIEACIQIGESHLFT